MPAPRQQRRNNARGNPGFKRIATAGAIIVQSVSRSGNQLILHFGAVSPTITLNGTPSIERVSDSTLPIGAAWGGGDLTLLYSGAALGHSEQFTVPNRDPAFRGSSGEYIPAGTLTTDPPPPTPQVQLINGGETCNIGFACVPNADAQVTQADASGVDGDIFVVAVPFSFATGMVVNGVASGSPVGAGGNVTFTHTGGVWVG